MKRSSLTAQRLAALFLLGCALFNYPLLALFNRSAEVFGIPLLYAFIFGAWFALIALMALVVERRED
jgi:predicted permease